MNELLLHDTGTFIPLASITKLALYEYAHKKGRLPRYGIIYIGQKHNVRLYDTEEKIHKQITLEEIDDSDLFFDWVHDPYWTSDEYMVSFSMRNNTLYLNYQGNAHEINLIELNLSMTMSVTPEYLITPTLN